jgi:voltage-gated potassium channel
MSLFLIASRLVRSAGHHRERSLLMLAATIVVIGAGLFSLTQHVDFGTALYWAITTATTVGYGDVLPHNTAGRVIAAGLMLTAIPIVGLVFALLAGASALTRIRRLLGMDTSLPTVPYIVVYGSHPVVPRALAELGRGRDPVVLIAPHRPAGTGEDVRLLAGDPADDEVIRRSEPSRACRALIAATNDADTLVIAVALHSLAPALEVYALTQTPRVAQALRDLGVAHTLSSDELVGHMLAKSLEAPQAGDLLLALVNGTAHHLRERPIDESLVSQPLSKARAAAGTPVLGVSRGERIDLGIGSDPVLAAGDQLIVLEAVAPA